MEKRMTKANARRLWWAAFALWTLFIWAQSLTPGDLSQGESTAALSFFERLFGFDASALGFDIHYLLRKRAHLPEYAVLGAVARMAWTDDGGEPRTSLAAAIGFCVASIDELLQFIAPDRAPMVLDVVFDCSGYALGFMAASGVLALLAKRRARS